jgi:hypothetical protein
MPSALRAAAATAGHLRGAGGGGSSSSSSSMVAAARWQQQGGSEALHEDKTTQPWALGLQHVIARGKADDDAAYNR